MKHINYFDFKSRVILIWLGFLFSAAASSYAGTSQTPSRAVLAEFYPYNFANTQYPQYAPSLVEHVLRDYTHICHAKLRFSMRDCHPNRIIRAERVKSLKHFPTGGFIAETYFPKNEFITEAIIEIRQDQSINNFWGSYLILHELGHAYGLDHINADEAPAMLANVPRSDEVTLERYLQEVENLAKAVIRRANIWNYQGPRFN